MSHARNNIILVGMPGSGKTTVGSLVSKKTGFDFIDLDLFIENKEKMTIAEIFKIKGEAYFRKLEFDTLVDFLQTEFNNKILSTGGGTFQSDKNIEILKKLGVVFYLKITPDRIFERIKNDTTRPLLQKDNPLGVLKSLYEIRKSNYELADVIIDASREAKVTAEDIYEKFNCSN